MFVVAFMWLIPPILLPRSYTSRYASGLVALVYSRFDRLLVTCLVLPHARAWFVIPSGAITLSTVDRQLASPPYTTLDHLKRIHPTLLSLRSSQPSIAFVSFWRRLSHS